MKSVRTQKTEASATASGKHIFREGDIVRCVEGCGGTLIKDTLYTVGSPYLGYCPLTDCDFITVTGLSGGWFKSRFVPAPPPKDIFAEGSKVRCIRGIRGKLTVGRIYTVSRPYYKPYEYFGLITIKGVTEAWYKDRFVAAYPARDSRGRFAK